MPRKPVGKRSITSDGAVAVRGKNANGAGSVYVNGDGVWRATYVDHTRRRRVVRGRTQAEAVARRDAAIARDTEDAARSTQVPTRFTRASTVGELSQWWLEQQRHRVRASSFPRYVDRVAHVLPMLGSVPVVELRPEQVAVWQTTLLDELASGTVSDIVAVLRSVLNEAVTLGLVVANVALAVKPPKVVRGAKSALTPEQTHSLLAAIESRRYAGAVAMLFLQGWRVSEVLGLAWQDIDLDAGVAAVRRAGIYVDGAGVMLGPCKNEGAEGVHHLAPSVVGLLRKRRQEQDEERASAGAAWAGAVEFRGEALDLIWTNDTGGLANRQAIAKAVKAAATEAGLDATKISTHTGRRTVVTNAYAEGGASLEDLARHVGHASTKTTATYVKALGKRPQTTASMVFGLLDPASATPRVDS